MKQVLLSGIALILLIAAAWAPQWLLFLLALALAKGLVVLGLLLLMRTGLVSFGQGLYFGLGAYAAALLAHRAAHVHSIEINPTLKTFGEANLRRAGVRNATTESGDAARGWPKHAPYDVIVLTGSTPVLPEALLAQLKPRGRLFAVVGELPVMSARLVTCVAEGSYRALDLFETVLAPLKNAEQREKFVF